MDDSALLRYSRHILLPEFDVDGQERLRAATALIIGLGGLGSPVAMYLASAGVGRLILVDFDTVELSNLQRQILYGTGDLEQPKTAAAQRRLADINPEVRIDTVAGRLGDDALLQACRNADVVIDCSDNFSTRFALNSACVEAGTALVSGAAIRFEGQVSVFDTKLAESPCYRCLYADSELPEDRCSDAGVIAPLLGIIGSVQATETLKMLAGVGAPLIGRVLLLDARTMEWQSVRLKRDPSCPVCGVRPGGA